MIILDAQVEAIATRKDKTVKITLGTQEMRDVGELFQLQNQLVSIGIATNTLTDDQVALLRESKFDLEVIPTGKSSSQRLRGVLFRVWENDNGGFDQFENYYTHKIETIISHFKNQL
jgi:hypothetical protein|tara:strand:+ start:470 stop:820 length:351 start_codon:yes stop_codon:yes gene_type:complete